MKNAWAAAGVAVLALLSSMACRVGPAYTTPATPQPPQFTEQPPRQFEESKDWKTASPADALHRGRWWEIFNDPELNALETQVDPANETLKSAEARFRQARALIRENRASKYPTVTAGAGITRNRLSLNQPVPAPVSESAYGDFALPIDVSYEADVWGRIRSLIESSVREAQASAADVESVRLSLHAELALDYFDLRSVDEDRRILDDSVKAYTRAFDLTENRFKGGVANRVEVAEAETQLEATRAQEIDLGELRAQYRHAIAVLTGQPPEGFALPEKAAAPALPVIPTGVPSQLLERRPDIAAGERRVAAANSQIGFAKAAFYPQVMLGATLGLESSSIASWFNWPSRLWAIGPSALQTIFDAGRRRAVLDENVANYDALVADYRQGVLSAFQQVEDNLASLRVLESESLRQAKAVDAARQSEALSLNRYKGGLVTYLEVVTAQSITLQNERVAVGLERRRHEASVLLIKALGGGWDANSLPQPAQLMSKR
jgi:NodT family efflux transporter outer membrane factor (OMF) lipoprotein